MEFIRKIDFGLDVLEKNDFKSYYSYVFNDEIGGLISKSQNNDFLKNKAFIINEVPSYIKTKINNSSDTIKIKTINTYSGSFINISKYNNIDLYLKKEISSQRRSTLNRCQKRLDLCINPSYKIFYGDISRTEYNKIFNDYKLMLKRRLAQKNSYWEELEFWEERYARTYDLINEKKASIFVIYDSDKPISIYINSNFNDILYIEVIAYDIDYSKFKLGFSALVKVIEWAILNNYKLIDMSKGDFYYKERFRNGTYYFQKHLIYDNSNLSIKLNIFVLFLKLKAMYNLLPILKKLKINKIYRSYIIRKNKNKLSTNTLENYSFSKEKIDSFNFVKSDKINIEEAKYFFLKEEFHNYLFLNFEKKTDVDIYKINDAIFFKGQKTIQKTTVTKL
ncbi:GNAT family N-acetyltransferase [Thalassobellus suaedae]|uniref:GNAT family N-acetyltransferase n=1 Tax=Thalassobellus suaedae TaxID=3074124 RepID=A0ABY9XX71_9FLAO|nr:GNAT family N-acetyltransferase [Flavobacteriaceae bacterium HL-DH14]